MPQSDWADGKEYLNCNDPRVLNFLTEQVSDCWALIDEERILVEEHLDSCPKCRKIFEAMDCRRSIDPADYLIEPADQELPLAA